MPADAAINKVSCSQDRRFPPPHSTIAVFMCTSVRKFSLFVGARQAPILGRISYGDLKERAFLAGQQMAAIVVGENRMR
jgi:hypothetical protein